jgi:hypothetical protein
MYPVVYVNRSNSQPLRPMCSQRSEQRRRINSAAQGDDDPNIGETRQQFSQVSSEPLRAEWLRGYFSAVSENSPKDAIRAERDARNSSRGIASS